MSDRVRNRQSGGPTNIPSGLRDMTKSQKRAAYKAAAERAAARRRRMRTLTVGLAGLAVVGLLVTIFVIANRDGDGAAPTGSAPTAGAQPADDTFPPLPEGADPALGTKPAAGAGTGELTKLTVTPLIEGKGAAAAAGQTITVNYVGVSYKTGKEFDASWKRSEPFSFTLGAGEVIPGWDQGLVGAKLGSRVQIDIPSKLAYGDNPAGGRPAGPLRFVVDVLGLR